MTTGYVVITGTDGDHIENGEIGAFLRVFASREDALSEILGDIQEAMYNEDTDGGPDTINPYDHCTVHRREDGLPFFVSCYDCNFYYQIEEVEYP